MKQNNNDQIVFDMFEEVATESIAEARNAYTYEEIDGCYQEAKEIADKARNHLRVTVHSLLISLRSSSS